MRRRTRIFVSHAEEDRAFAEKVVAELRDHGFNPWISSMNLAGSDEWQREIGRALSRCDWFLLIGSRSCYRSKWVKRELSYAFRNDRYNGRILPILKNSCDLQRLAWPLLGIQYIDCRRTARGFDGGVVDITHVLRRHRRGNR